MHVDHAARDEKRDYTQSSYWRVIAVLTLLELYQYIVRMNWTCNASTKYASSICMLHTWGAVFAFAQFSFFNGDHALSPEGSVGLETALSTDLGTDPKISWLFLARVFALVMHVSKYLLHLLVLYALLFLRFKHVEATSLVLFVRTECTSCARAIGHFTLSIVFRQAFLPLFMLVLKAKTVVIGYFFWKLRIEYYSRYGCYIRQF